MEMTGTGIIQAREQAELYKSMALEVTQCVLEQPDGQKTATEVERNFAAMLARADTFREQYGEMGVKRLINMVLVAAVQLTKPRITNGTLTRFEIKLPKTADGVEQKLGKGPFQAQLQWPPYFEPSLDDANKAVQAATGAKLSGFIDDEHAAKFLAPYFQMEDVQEVLDSAKAANGQVQADIEREALDGPEGMPEPAAPDKAQDVALNGAQVTALADLVKSVAAGELPGASAVEILIIGFPISREVAEKMINAAAPTPKPGKASGLILP
jgi:predicted enzyme related to lactoylglutathione lyase